MRNGDFVAIAVTLSLVVASSATARAQDIPTGAVYSSQIRPPSHSEATPADPPDPDGKRPMFTPRRSGEKVVVTDSSKPVEIKKLKFGADVSEPTGVFKGSPLDSDLQLSDKKPAPKAGEKAAAPANNAARAVPSATPVAPEHTAQIDKKAAPAQDIALSLAPAATASPTATPRQ